MYAMQKVAVLAAKSTTRMSFRNSVEPYTGSMMRASSSSAMIMTSTCRTVGQQQDCQFRWQGMHVATWKLLQVAGLKRTLRHQC